MSGIRCLHYAPVIVSCVRSFAPYTTQQIIRRPLSAVPVMGRRYLESTRRPINNTSLAPLSITLIVRCVRRTRIPSCLFISPTIRPGREKPSGDLSSGRFFFRKSAVSYLQRNDVGGSESKPHISQRAVGPEMFSRLLRP